MKRLLTYGLLLLTILASHFVVSACQDDSDKTTIVMTFTTRVENPRLDETTGESAEVPKEQMKELRIIMAREDGTVIYNEKTGVVGNEHEFSFDVPMMTYKERFQFVVIANETALVSSNENAINLSNVDKDAFNNLKTLKIGQDGFDSQYIPQTIYWAQDIIYGETTKIRKELQFVVGKITVEFENQTEEAQSLSNIHIKGIIPNAQGYLLAQASNDFVGTQHVESAMQAADIIFNPVEDLGEGNSSGIQHYYTYPVGTGGIASTNLPFTQSDKQYEQPTLFATWNGIEYNLPITEVTDEEGNVHPFTSLARNERLKIVITLTPAGDITVNYTIAAWINNPTNIDDTAPTTPDNDYNDYYVYDWGTGGIIDVGGGNNNGWNVAPGVTITGKEVWHWEIDIDVLESDRREIPIPSEFLVPGYELLFNFMCLNPNGPDPESIQIEFWNANDAVLVEDATFNDKTYIWDTTANYYRYFTLTERVIELINQGWSKNLVLKTINLTYPENPVHIKIIKLFIVNPDNGGASTDAEQQ